MNRDTGNRGEDIAVQILEKSNYEIIERNFRYGKGEIDIIAKDREILVFVEVKSRTNLKFGLPEQSISRAKQLQIKKIASAYLYKKELLDHECRIDVITVLFRKEEKPRVNHIKNAF